GQAGWLQTSGNPADVTGQSGVDVTGSPFGNFQLFTITGLGFDDRNGNGILDTGEGGAAGAVARRDIGGAGTPHRRATADASGNFSFSNLGPGTYRVREAGLSGAIQTSTNPGDITGASGLAPPAVQFGNFTLVTLRGQVFEDTNGNGSKDDGNTGLAGRSVSLDAGADGSVEQTTTTDANGNFSLPDLGPGTYRGRAAGQTRALPTPTTPR